MKFRRFDEERWGWSRATGQRCHGGTRRAAVSQLSVPQHDLFIAHLDAAAARARELARDAPVLPLDRVSLPARWLTGKIIAAPVNYQKHLDAVRDNRSSTATTREHVTIHSAGSS